VGSSFSTRPSAWEPAAVFAPPPASDPSPHGSPVKKQTTARIDADVVAWLKSKGAGHISRVNEIPRKAMLADLKR